MKVSVCDIEIFCGFFLILLSICAVFSEPVDSVLLYSGYLFILVPSYWRFIKKKSRKKDGLTLLMIIVLLSFGILTQDINVGRKITLIISYALTASFSIVAGYLIDDLKKMKIIANSILFCFFTVLIITFYFKERIYMIPTEGASYALTLALGHKNYFGAAAFSAYTALYIYEKYVRRKQSNRFWMAVLSILIIASVSRTIWIMFALFHICAHFNWIYKFVRKFKKLLFFVIPIVGMRSISFVMDHLQQFSQSFYFRFQGFLDYCARYLGDPVLFFFGNGEELYNESSTYTLNAFMALGGSGTFEMGILNILVKTGFIGLVAYIIIFLQPFRVAKKRRSWRAVKLAVLLEIPMIASAFVEPFIVNPKLLYTVFCWCSISCLVRCINRGEFDGDMQLNMSTDKTERFSILRGESSV